MNIILFIIPCIFPDKPADRCFLTSDELAQWSTLYQVHGTEADEVQTVPDQGGQFVTLKKTSTAQVWIIGIVCFPFSKQLNHNVELLFVASLFTIELHLQLFMTQEPLVQKCFTKASHTQSSELG